MIIKRLGRHISRKNRWGGFLNKSQDICFYGGFFSGLLSGIFITSSIK